MQQSSGETDTVAGATLAACDSAVVATDEHGRVRAWNDAATERFGWAPADVLGEVCPLSPTAEERCLDTTTDAVLDGERVDDVSVTVTDRSGTDHRLDLSLAPLRLESDEPDGVVATFTSREDVATLQQRTERLEEFAGAVAHDLRGPLNAAQASVELAREQGEEEHFDRARRCLDRIESIIGDTLSLCREGSDGARLADVGLATAVADAWEAIGESDGHLLVDEDVRLQADPSQFERLLVNLLQNALDHGGDTVTVRVGPLADGAGFYVADDGPGVPDDRRDCVFDFGYSTEDGGTGYGLTIVERIADLHGWSVTVTDSEYGGACFEVRTA